MRLGPARDAQDVVDEATRLGRLGVGLEPEPESPLKRTQEDPTMHRLNWTKCEGQAWCPFLTVNLAHSHFNGLGGVYVIWHGGTNPKTVYVGQGDIKARLTEHRKAPLILQYSASGLFVTWARVDHQYRSGIERYLADRLTPLEGANHPHVAPLSVNLPW